MREPLAARYLGFFFGRCQPGMVTCFDARERELAGGASFVIVEPAPIVAPAPIVTGATSIVPSR